MHIDRERPKAGVADSGERQEMAGPRPSRDRRPCGACSGVGRSLRLPSRRMGSRREALFKILTTVDGRRVVLVKCGCYLGWDVAASFGGKLCEKRIDGWSLHHRTFLS